MKPEFKSITCCICQKAVDPMSFYAMYNSEQYAHTACFAEAAKVRHNTKLINFTKSKLVRA